MPLTVASLLGDAAEHHPGVGAGRIVRDTAVAVVRAVIVATVLTALGVSNSNSIIIVFLSDTAARAGAASAASCFIRTLTAFSNLRRACARCGVALFLILGA